MKKLIKKYIYGKLKTYLKFKIDLERGLRDSIEIPILSDSNKELYYKSIELRSGHTEKIVAFNEILSFIENEERI